MHGWFRDFSDAYPLPVDPATFRPFKAACPDAETFAALMAGLERWKKSERWLRGIIQRADNFLRQQMWTKEPPVPLSKAEAFQAAQPEWVPGASWGGRYRDVLADSRPAEPDAIEAQYAKTDPPANVRQLRRGA